MVLAAFGSARLLTFDRDPMLDVPTVEVAHEAVLTQWDRLRVWITESREELTIGRRLADLAAEWDRNDKADEFLLTPGRLELYARFVETTSLLIGVTERGFIEANLSAEKRRRRRNRSLRVTIVAALSVVASVAVVAAFVAATNSRRAE